MLDELGLFLGSFFDSLIGPNIFVPAEPFLITAGYQFYKGNSHALIAVFLGGLIGDQISFFIGRHYGCFAQRKVLRRFPSARRTMARCRLLMNRHACKVMTFARLLGPIAWFVPFMAGVNQIRWQQFSFYAFIGLVLGIGQFIVWGYLLASGVSHIDW
ncbi:DedA family protein [Vibrio sagamiensis]|uniref:VTT domain-containing protein n=1 Tax=Vibrio sagamiensis NBRC 104589 TaxID=1219064 RepID=A0A511QCM9_9VIBR|nr:DedA family protein [Vibrio sagamiensis]PNQ54033.1 DedA family protein [Vibrio agarivorans]GEM75043.1 hypothetical protein VSA01S_11550 [Vibrio sagamiensis NBRC 104589]